MSSAHFCDALDLEDAAHAINHINARKRREDIELRRAEHAPAISLGGGDALAAWLTKDDPK